MSEPKWTPGPYTVTADDATKIADARGSLAMMMHTHLLGRRNGDEVLATARLFAAAPDLYAALVELIAIRDAMVEAGGTQGPLAEETIWSFAQRQAPAVNAARAALAKARGEASDDKG